MAWLLTHPGPHGIDLNEVPAAQALWSLAFVLAALRWRPALAWLDRAPPLSTAIRLINARAVTIYLWHNPLISVAGLLTAAALDDTGPFNRPLLLTTVLRLTAVAVAAVGWVEDLAAHRAPGLWPLPRRNPGQARLRQSRPPSPAGALTTKAPHGHQVDECRMSTARIHEAGVRSAMWRRRCRG